jgi:hypothetical protein
VSELRHLKSEAREAGKLLEDKKALEAKLRVIATDVLSAAAGASMPCLSCCRRTRTRMLMLLPLFYHLLQVQACRV